MRTTSLALPCLIFLGCAAACGVAYEAASSYRANRMSKDLRAGMSMADVHRTWGEPDIRAYPDSSSEIWSYAKHANTDDPTAALLYTASKPGDRGTFLDLKFMNGLLASWDEAQHTMPLKQGGGFSIGTGGTGAGAGTHF